MTDKQADSKPSSNYRIWNPETGELGAVSWYAHLPGASLGWASDQYGKRWLAIAGEHRRSYAAKLDPAKTGRIVYRVFSAYNETNPVTAIMVPDGPDLDIRLKYFIDQLCALVDFRPRYVQLPLVDLSKGGE